MIAGCSVMLVFLFTISSTMANKEKMETNSTQSDQENPLDAEFHKAMKESGTSTASMIQILNEYAGKWKTEMEKKQFRLLRMLWKTIKHYGKNMQTARIS